MKNIRSSEWRFTACAACALALSGAFRASAAPGGDPAGILELKNGDRLLAVIEEFDAVEGRLSARHPAIEDPVRIRADWLLRYTAAPPISDEAAQPWRVDLSNGDRLAGGAPRLEDGSARVTNHYAGELSVPRERVRAFSRTSRLRPIYMGPSPGETWTTARDQDFVLEGDSLALLGSLAVGRRIEGLPRKARFDFTFRTQQAMSLFFHFYGNDPGEANPSQAIGYQFSVQGNNRIILQRREGHRTLAIGSTEFSPGRSASGFEFRITLYCNLDERTHWVFVDGQRVGEWTEARDFPDPGDAINFLARGVRAEVADIEVYAWDGRLPADYSARPPPASDSLFLINGDNLSGELVRMDGKSVWMRTAFGEISVPLERLDRVETRGEHVVAESNPGAVRVLLHDGSRVTLDLESIRAGEVSGKDANFGPLRFPVRSIASAVWRDESAAAPPPARSAVVGMGVSPEKLLEMGLDERAAFLQEQFPEGRVRFVEAGNVQGAIQAVVGARGAQVRLQINGEDVQLVEEE